MGHPPIRSTLGELTFYTFPYRRWRAVHLRKKIGWARGVTRLAWSPFCGYRVTALLAWPTIFFILFYWDLSLPTWVNLVQARHYLGTLWNYDENGNGNVKKSIGSMRKTTTLHVHHPIWHISSPSLYNYDVKWKARRWIIPSLSPLLSSNLNFIVLSNWATWDNREMVWKDAESIIQRRFHERHRFRIVRSLMRADASAPASNHPNCEKSRGHLWRVVTHGGSTV